MRWFVDGGLDAIRMLAASAEPIGVLLALDVRLRHSNRVFRELAGSEVRRIAREDGLNMVTFSTFGAPGQRGRVRSSASISA